MFKVYASQLDSGAPAFISIRSQDFATREEAAAVAAIFPKFVLAGVGRTAHAARTGQHRVADTFSVGLTVKLLPTKGNERNEGGIKRYRSFQAKAAQAGYSMEFVQPSPLYMTEGALEAAIS